MYGELFLSETVAAHLKKQPGFSVSTARLDDPEQGLSDAALGVTDVLIIWCHRRVKDQGDARAEAVVFEEKWDKGEHFRSGCVFYFRPGHVTYPVFNQA